MNAIYDRAGVEANFIPGSWQRIIFSELASTLSSAERQFPCIFGAAGFKSDQLRYAFLQQLDAPGVADLLSSYLPKARMFGPNTSLVVMEPPGPVQSVKDYGDRFWSLLCDLRAADKREWPVNIPESVDDPLWEFCFQDEPIFVVCNTPAHLQRQSRRSSTFMLTFQPRWVFDTILNTPAAAQSAFGKVRKILSRYDFIERSPHLGLYGSLDNRESRQYFLDDDNSHFTCPVTSLRR